jgi:hypothetical protein
VFFANEQEARLLDVAGAPFAGTLTVVKQGAGPTIVTAPGGPPQLVPVPPAPPARDSTGAGDAFAAGFLAALAHGRSPVDAAVAGHRLARSVLLTPGATLARPDGPGRTGDGARPDGAPGRLRRRLFLNRPGQVLDRGLAPVERHVVRDHLDVPLGPRHRVLRVARLRPDQRVDPLHRPERDPGH